MPANVSFALLLTLLAGLSTGIGSAVAFFIRKPKPQHMSLILGFSAGVMLFISFAELLHTAIDKDVTSVQERLIRLMVTNGRFVTRSIEI